MERGNMHEGEATQKLESAVVVTREDIVRAKSYVLKAEGGNTDELTDRFLQEQRLGIPRKIDGDAPNIADVLASVARAISVRLALYQAIWELVAVGELIPAGSSSRWQPTIGYKSLGYGGGLRPKINCAYPSVVERLPLVSELPTDTDIFLQGINCKTLHPGIHEAITQALGCFARGLYMPATAMLAAATEGTWTECGIAIARKLTNTKLEGIVNDQLASISKVVTETRKVLEQPAGKILLGAAGQHIAKVTDAEVWTTTLRDRRNALHWGKAKSFIADHSETGTLLMAAPLHMGTLEAIRAAC
jgi:hypothetical protein